MLLTQLGSNKACPTSWGSKEETNAEWAKWEICCDSIKSLTDVGHRSSIVVGGTSECVMVPPWRGHLPMNNSWITFMLSMLCLQWTPSSKRSDVGSINWSSGNKLDYDRQLRHLGITRIGIVLLLLYKEGLSHLSMVSMLKNRGCTWHSLLECYFTSLHNTVSLKVKYMIRLWM